MIASDRLKKLEDEECEFLGSGKNHGKFEYRYMMRGNIKGKAWFWLQTIYVTPCEGKVILHTFADTASAFNQKLVGKKLKQFVEILNETLEEENKYRLRMITGESCIEYSNLTRRMIREWQNESRDIS